MLAHAFRSKLLDELVHLLDGLCGLGHHVFGVNLKFVDEAVDFVDERTGRFLLQGLTNHRFGLWHGPFNRTRE